MSEKLVRDKVVENILKKGERVKYYIVKGEYKYSKLMTKLIEEKQELIDAIQGGEIENISEEMVDVIEVLGTISGEFSNKITTETQKHILSEMAFLDEIIEKYKIDNNQLFELKQQKLKTKGAFKEGIVLIMD